VKICDDQSDEIRSHAIRLFTLHAAPEMAGIRFNILIEPREKPFPLEALVEWSDSNENGNGNFYPPRIYDGPCIIHDCNNWVHRAVKKCQLVYGKGEDSDVNFMLYPILTQLVENVAGS